MAGTIVPYYWIKSYDRLNYWPQTIASFCTPALCHVTLQVLPSDVGLFPPTLMLDLARVLHWPTG